MKSHTIVLIPPNNGCYKKKAIEMGYTIVTIHEVWHFPKNQRKIGLFANYVNK